MRVLAGDLMSVSIDINKLESAISEILKEPGLVLINSKAGRMVWAVVVTEPETMPSASPL